MVAAAAAMLATSFTACKSNPPEPPELSNNIDIYVAGTDDSGSEDAAKVWKNGKELYVFTNGSDYAGANSIFVAENKVYAVGNDGNVAKLWKNKSATNLTDGSYRANAFSVFVAGSNVYTVGCEDNGKNTIAKVWRNGSEHLALTDGSNSAQANSVFVVGEDVYTAGDDGKVAKVWKNKKVVFKTSGSNSAFAYSVYVVGEDIYVAGVEVEGSKWVAKVWKNNKELYKLADNGIAKSIVVHNGDVYVAGGHQSNGINFAAKVWKNGKELYTLANIGFAWSIFIVEKK